MSTTGCAASTPCTVLLKSMGKLYRIVPANVECARHFALSSSTQTPVGLAEVVSNRNRVLYSRLTSVASLYLCSEELAFVVRLSNTLRCTHFPEPSAYRTLTPDLMAIDHALPIINHRVVQG